MMHCKIVLPFLTALLMLSGCATNHNKYEWGSYENGMYSYYKDPAAAAAWATQLEQTIQIAESGQKILAPGVYAEYGYLLMQQGKNQEAIIYFQKEKKQWPEAAYFMGVMIKTASDTPGKAAVKGSKES
ncbi:DUF4810 domain-containing protein [Glaciimonas sp. PCH181]|uniref:DUF4810 domain-containing protein n=1 Tax=Glaciimonas sp. PCH181 TaxID=2133943 RepID=UPI000D3DC06C|nr:DUF4810 domain-containing protein [Glaciimonas sp. PCH181]PUA20595.1 DUF4810 domain-containing protein [Glaciimonas sp. PCH181]